MSAKLRTATAQLQAAAGKIPLHMAENTDQKQSALQAITFDIDDLKKELVQREGAAGITGGTSLSTTTTTTTSGAAPPAKGFREKMKHLGEAKSQPLQKSPHYSPETTFAHAAAPLQQTRAHMAPKGWTVCVCVWVCVCVGVCLDTLSQAACFSPPQAHISPAHILCASCLAVFAAASGILSALTQKIAKLRGSF